MDNNPNINQFIPDQPVIKNLETQFNPNFNINSDSPTKINTKTFQQNTTFKNVNINWPRIDLKLI